MNISKEVLALIAVRLLSLYFAVIAFGATSSAYLFSSAGEGLDISRWYVLSPLISWSVAAVLLWVFAEPLARKMCGSAIEVEEQAPATSLQEFWGLAFAVVGLLTLTDAIPHLTQVLAFHFTKASVSAGFPGAQLDLTASQISSLVVAIVKIILGLVLMLRWRGVTGVLLKLRQAGTER